MPCATQSAPHSNTMKLWRVQTVRLPISREAHVLVVVVTKRKSSHTSTNSRASCFSLRIDHSSVANYQENLIHLEGTSVTHMYIETNQLEFPVHTHAPGNSWMYGCHVIVWHS